MDQLQKGLAGFRAKFLGVDRAVGIRICRLELLLDHSRVFLGIERAVAVGIGALETGLVQTTCEFLGVQRAVLVRIERRKQLRAASLCLDQINGPVLVGIESRESRSQRRRRRSKQPSGSACLPQRQRVRISSWLSPSVGPRGAASRRIRLSTEG